MSFHGFDVDSAGCITQFAQYRYDERKDVSVEVICGAVGSSLPGDYRTRRQLDEHWNRQRDAEGL